MNRFLLFALATATLPLTLSSPHVAMAQGATAPAAQSPQIEVEISYLSVEAETFNELGITAEPYEGDSGPFTRSKIATTLSPEALVNDLVSNKKGRILTAPRAHMRFNQQADLRAYRSGFANIGQQGGPESVLNQFTRGVVPPTPEMVKEKSPLTLYVGKFQIKTGQGFTAQPTLNTDGTVNLKINPGMTVELFYEKPSATAQNKLEKVTVMKNDLVEEQTLANLKDGQTVILMPNDPATLSGLFGRERIGNFRYIVLFVTTRRLKPGA